MYVLNCRARLAKPRLVDSVELSMESKLCARGKFRFVFVHQFGELFLEYLPRCRRDLLEISCIAKILDGWMSVGTIHLVLVVVVFGDESLVEFLVST